METFGAWRWVVLAGGIACGARTGLPVPDEDQARGGGGAAAAGGGGAGGGVDPVTCEDLVPSLPAHVRLPNGAATVISVEMVRPPGAQGLACIVSDVANDDGTWDVAHGCFEAWGAWPGSLGMAFLTDGADGGVAATEGRQGGYAILVGSHAGAMPRVSLDVPPTQSEVTWKSLSMQALGHRATLLARAPDGAFFGGLARPNGEAERLEVFQIDPPSPVSLGEIACATGPLSAAAVAIKDKVVIATSTGEEGEGCATTATPGPPNGLRVIALDRAGGREMLYEAWYADPVVDVAAVEVEDDIWLARDGGGAASMIRLGADGLVAQPVTIGKQTRGAVALARRGDSVAAAFVARDSGGETFIGVVELDPDGAVKELGRLATQDAPWLRDLELVADPSSGSLIVAYVGRIGANERAFAWRLGCP